MEKSIGGDIIPTCMKEEEVAFRVLETPFGKMGLTVTDRGLRELTFSRRVKENIGSHAIFEKLRSDMDRYFQGKPVDFLDIEVDMSDYTPFERDVLEMTRRIPYGQTASYKDIAERIGRPKACRAVGNALHKNRTGIVVPCHRVIKSDGSLGGFGGGIERKKRLLRLEHIL